MAGDETGELEALLHGGDDWLLAEHQYLVLEAAADVVEMEVVGRADHQEVEPLGAQQRLRRPVGRSGRDAELTHVGQAGRSRIDVADHPKVRIDRLEHPRQIAEAVSQADDPYSHARRLLLDRKSTR